MTTPQIDRTTTRHIARVLPFDATLAPYIDYDAIARAAAELGCHWDVRRQTGGAITITLFWENPS